MDPAEHPLLRQPRPDVVAVVPVGSDDLQHFGDTDLLVHGERWFLAYGGDLRYDVLLRLDFDGKTSHCGEVRFRQRPDRPEPITVSGTRGVPLGALISRALNFKAVAHIDRDGIPAVSAVSFVTTERPERRRLAEAVQESGRRRTRDEELQKVAEVYVDAARRGVYPTAAVQAALNLGTRNQAKKWVARARKTGFLAAAPGERKGGIAR